MVAHFACIITFEHLQWFLPVYFLTHRRSLVWVNQKMTVLKVTVVCFKWDCGKGYHTGIKLQATSVHSLVKLSMSEGPSNSYLVL